MERDFARAFECCLRVKSRNPSWAGLDDRVNRVLFAEGRRALVDGDDERGLRLLRELLGRKRDYPGLLDQIAEAYGKRIDRALRMGLYVRGRRVLHELAEVTGEHAAVRASRAVFVARATERIKQGEKGRRARPSACSIALVDALRIWPTPGRRRGKVHPGVRGRADARRGGDRRRGAVGSLGPLAGRCPGDPAALPARSRDRRPGGSTGQEAGSARGVRREFGPEPSAADPPASRAGVVRRIAAGLGHRRGPLDDRAQRPAFSQLRGALGRPARPRRGPRRDAGRAAAQPRAVEIGRLAARSGRAGARRDRRPDRDLDQGSRPGHRRNVYGCFRSRGR